MQASPPPDDPGEPETPVVPPSPEPGAPVTAPPAIDLSGLHDALTAGFTSLSERFDARLRYDLLKESLVDRLHDELKGLRAEQSGRALRPFVDGILRLRRDLERTVADLSGPTDPVVFVPLLESFRDQATLLLANEGIDAFETPGNRFDPRTQRSIGTLPASDAEHVGAVARRVHPGFRSATLLYERESVVLFGPPRPADPGPPPDSDSPPTPPLASAS